MRRWIVAASLPVVLALAAPATAVGATPTRFGKPATHFMHTGDPMYLGTAATDVVVGSDGDDVVATDGNFGSTAGGTDLVCGGGGNDRIFVGGPGSKADGGLGNDVVSASSGALAQGGGGDDGGISADGIGGRAEGGSGNDSLHAYPGAGALYGGSGSDEVHSSGGVAQFIDCGSGYGVVEPGAGITVQRCEGITK